MERGGSTAPRPTTGPWTPPFNMIRVGEAMTRILEEAGIAVLHDTTLHDYPSYNGSYDKALESIEAIWPSTLPYKW